MSNYKELWRYFLANEAKDFEEVRGLTIKEIKNIGVRKFVRANDWRTITDVPKWRTDMYDIIPCPHCLKDFGILDTHLGLCDRCYSKFDMVRFFSDMDKIASGDSELSGKMLVSFLGIKRYRDTYLKGRR